MVTHSSFSFNDREETMTTHSTTHPETPLQMEDVTDPNQPSTICVDENEQEATSGAEDHFQNAIEDHSGSDQEPNMSRNSQLQDDDKRVAAPPDSVNIPTDSQLKQDDEMVDALLDSGDSQKEDTPDLFERTFTKTQSIKDRDESDGEQGNSPVKENKGKQVTKDNFDPSEHGEGCNGRSASTPPPTASQTSKKSTSKSQRDPNAQPPIDPNKDQCLNIRRHQRFHNRVKNFHPKLVIAPNRYWIGVIPVGKKPTNVKDEKHITWMRGNRKTTVRTVQESYMIATMTPDVVIMFWKERIDGRTRMEQMDNFNDKIIILRAVNARDPESKGVELGEGWEPKPFPNQANKGKASELSNATVIEIDSD